MITFKKLRYKNILSTGNYFTEIELDQTSNTLIVGTNGSGKSTMLDALCFVLFGKAFRNINKPNLVNSINGKDCLVELEFTTSNKDYKIVRGIKPNKFEIYQNNELINQDAASKDYQEFLEKNIIKLNYKSFTQIVILGSASFTPFMQLSPADRRTIIEDLLDIQIFSTMNNLMKDKIAENKETTNEAKNQIKLITQKYDLQKKYLDEKNQNTDDRILELQNEEQINLKQTEKLFIEIDSLQKEVEQFDPIISMKKTIEDKIKKISKLELQIEGNITKCEKDIAFFDHSDNCPTCRQSIAEEFKSSELINLNAKIKEYENGLEQIKVKLSETQIKLSDITCTQKKVQSIQIEIAKKNATITELQKYLTKIQKEISSLKNNKNNSSKDHDELESLKIELLALQESLKELLNEKTYFEVASGLPKDSGIKTRIIKQYLPIINKLVNKYLASLDFFVNFNLDESFKETIKSRHRDEFSYNNFSEGEKQRIDMSLMLTWRAVAKLKNSSNTNLLILDEVFDSSLDNNGTEYLMNILQMLEGVNLFVISHKGDILQDKFANVIRFEKMKNFSRIKK